MKKFSYDFDITERDEKEADKKIKAAQVLCRKLSADVMEKLAHIVEHEPGKVQAAMQFIK